MTATTLMTVEIPADYLTLCAEWHDGQSSMLYAIASTGDITLGDRRPCNDDGEPMSDHEWHVSLFDSLSCDLRHCARSARKSGHEDAQALREFETWADAKATELREFYGIES